MRTDIVLVFYLVAVYFPNSVHTLLKCTNSILSNTVRSQHRLFSLPEKKSPATTPPSQRSENIDLFAAGDRKLPPPVNNSTINKTASSSATSSSSSSNVALKTAPPSVQQEVKDKVIVDEVSPPSSTTTTTTTTTPTTSSPPIASIKPSIFGGKNRDTAKLEAQAELLRLEAEIEQMEIEQQRIKNERARLQQIDKLLLQYIKDNVKIETLLETQKTLFGKELFLRLIELINYETDAKEKQRLLDLYDHMNEEIKRIDNLLYTNIFEDLKKCITIEETRRKAEKRNQMIQKLSSVGDGSSKSGNANGRNATSTYEKAMEMWIQQTMLNTKNGNTNLTQIMNDFSSFNATILGSGGMKNSPTDSGSSTNSNDINNSNNNLNNLNNMNPLLGIQAMVKFPPSLPALLLPIIFRSPPLLQQDIDCLKQSVFTKDLLNNLTIEASPFLCVFRGNPIPTSSSNSNINSGGSSSGSNSNGMIIDQDTFEVTYEKIKSRINFFSSNNLIPITPSPAAYSYDSNDSEEENSLGGGSNSNEDDISALGIKVSPGMKDRIQLFVLPEYLSNLLLPPPPPQPVMMNGNNNNNNDFSNNALYNNNPLMPNSVNNNAGPNSIMTEKFSGLKYSPIYVVISNAAQPRRPGNTETIVGSLAFIGALLSSFIYSTDVYSMNKIFLEQVQSGNLITLDNVVSLTVGIVALQLFHDIGHVLSANYHKVAISLPYYLPSLQIGHFGTITNFLSFPKTRTQMFDVAVAGPFCGFVTSLLLLLYGLVLTQSASPAELSTYPALPTGFFTSSFLLYQITDSFLHISNTLMTAAASVGNSATSILTDPITTGAITGSSAANNNALEITKGLQASVTSIHPYVAAGVTGLLANAFNFMPIGRLDGGRAFTAVFGRKSAATISTVTLISQSLGLLVNSSPLALFWIINVVFLQRGQDIPPLDDIAPVGECSVISDSSSSSSSAVPTSGGSSREVKNVAYYTRLFAFGFCILMAAAVLLPMPVDFVSLTGGLTQPGSGTGAVLPIDGGIPV